MGEDVSRLAEVELIFRKAISCSACFMGQGSTLKRALVDTAQPRPIGENYWTSELRIVLMLLNPAAGKVAHAEPNRTFKRLLHAYAGGSGPLKSVFQHQRMEMPTWGSGQFGRLYLDGYGLKLNDIATANVAWCAERGDSYEAMLAPCFDRHTLPLLRTLQPHVVLLAGDKAQVFRAAIRDACPVVEVVPVMHYLAFNCLPRADKPVHLKAVRAELDRIWRAKQVTGIGSGDFRILKDPQISLSNPSMASEAMIPGRIPAAAAQPKRASVNSARASRFGNYKIVDPHALLKRASKRDDPRWEFYDAMMKLGPVRI